MKTYMAKGETVEHRWYVVDATDMVLGRLSSQVAAILRGKNKPIYTPHVDTGDHVIIINADKVRLTGKKWTDREYLRFTGYPGGQRAFTPEDLMKKSYKKTIKAGYHPLFVKVLRGMLPKNRLGRTIIENMHVYNGPEHPFADKEPKVIDINTVK